MVSLNHPDNNIKWITVNYENMVIDPNSELKRIFKKWGLKMPETIYKKIYLPSSSPSSGSLLKGYSQLEHWKNNLTKKEKDNIKGILNQFNVQAYSTDPMPLISYQD